ncbi:MAG: Wzz/FepE/Etk N-terminal domain-containing protein [Clostridiaceae bacterium]
MELYQYFEIIKKRVMLIVLITLTCIFASAIASFYVIKPVYQSEISVDIGNTNANTETKTSGQSLNDVMMYQKLVKTYAEYAKSRAVAEDIVTQLGLSKTPEQVMGMITATPSADTQFMTISVKSGNAEEAMNIANQAAKSLKSVTTKIKNVDNVQLVDDAVLPKSPVSPRPLMNIAIAFLLGIMASAGLIFLMEYLDNTVKDPEELEKLTGLPVIGSVPKVENNNGRRGKK